MSKRMLIIEDLPFWGMILGRMLKGRGINSDWVRNGMLGVEKIKEGKVIYDGIITDVQMPMMNGLDATKKIRKLGFTKPIIGFSSLGEEKDIAKGLEEGMDGYYRKGADFRELDRLLRKFNLVND